MAGPLAIRVDDPSSAAVRAMVALHLAGMRAHSPPGSVNAVDAGGLADPAVTVWTAWRGDAVAGMAALRRLGGDAGEVKSMRTHPDHLRTGVAAALLRHLVAQARGEGLGRLMLETGSGAAFAPALALYRAHGFADGPAFDDYADTGFNRFVHLAL